MTTEEASRDRTGPPDRTVRERKSDPPGGAKRFGRRRLLKWTLSGVGGAIAVAGADGLLIEPRWLDVHERPIELPALGPAWDGVRIAHLTDLHRGRLIGAEYARTVVERTNDLRPDFVVFTGDLISREDALDGLDATLKSLRPRVAKLAVLGNHDHWTDAEAVTGCLEAAGFEVLFNNARRFDRDGEPLTFVGLRDFWTDRADVSTALAAAPKGGPRVALQHNPDFAETLAPETSIDLMLCGHSHGGQVRVPWAGAPILPIRHRKYAAGLAAGPCCPVYTSRGLGMVGLPVRLFCRPEVPVLRLCRPRRSQSDAGSPAFRNPRRERS